MFQRLLLLVAIVAAIRRGISYDYESPLHVNHEYVAESTEMLHGLMAFVEDNNVYDGATEDDDDDDPVSEACKDGEVLQLNTNNFNLFTHTGRYFIMIYKPPLSYMADQAKIKWAKLARELNAKGTICISDLDCSKSNEICHDLQIRPSPTFLWYENGRKVRTYDADTELEHLKSFVEKMIASNGTFIEKSGARTRSYLTMNLITLALNYLAIKLPILVPN
ncbi:thioredoxin domain-containing protein 5 homolog [Drosophila miranda]|uniref:thioredoxin domain-containing protein 5 homolog n=1 Tax=Drosophila miranda TaxID=7229 RepID=UPI0007E89512|nr:thioredoxin domain-containing protein 5 homolog [Drosophila miranda]